MQVSHSGKRGRPPRPVAHVSGGTSTGRGARKRVKTYVLHPGRLNGADPLIPILLYVLVVTVSFTVFLMVKPGSHGAFTAIDNVLQFALPLGPSFVCLASRRGGGWRDRLALSTLRTRAGVPQLMALGACCFCAGQIIWTIYENVMDQPPYPSPADIGYLAEYPFLIAAILVLDKRVLRPRRLAYIVLDGVAVVGAMSLFSYYFVIGPAIEANADSVLAASVAALYPILDLFALSALLPLLFTRDSGVSTYSRVCLAAGTLIFAGGDTVFQYQEAHGIYHTGSLLDLSWPLGWMLLCVGAIAVRRQSTAGDTASESERIGRLDGTPLVTSLAPLILVPAACLFSLLAPRDGGDTDLTVILGLGPWLTVGVIVLRQALTTLEAHALYGRVRNALNAERAARRDLALSESKFHETFDEAPVGIIHYSLADRRSTFNRRMALMSGYPEPALEDVSLQDLLQEDDRTAVQAAIDRAIGGGGAQDVHARLLRSDRREIPAHIHINLLDRSDDASPSVVIIFDDESAERKLEEQLLHRALHDQLTGLPNRALLDDRIEQAVASGRRQDTTVTMLLMDLDGFKDVNDAMGHPVGDLLLQHVAGLLGKSLRESDTVARLGGDEFAILLPETSVDGGIAVAETLLEALNAPITVDDHLIAIGASIGIASSEHGRIEAATMLRQADLAMYEAKRGRTGYALFDADLDAMMQAKIRLQRDLRRAVERNEFVLHYQPQLDLVTGGLAGAEALLRWNHPERGLLPPGAFMPEAEQSDLIHAISRWVVEEALAQHRRWLARGLFVNVAVNLSARNLIDPDLAAFILRRTPSDRSRGSALTIEITETAVMENFTAACGLLSELRADGIHVALDDFGTGYSSLSYLQQIPADQVKIDRSFIDRVATSEQTSQIVGAIADLGHSLGLTVVAEGVETEEIVARLCSLRCDVLQGYVLSRPRSACEITPLLYRLSGMADGGEVVFGTAATSVATGSSTSTASCLINHGARPALDGVTG